MQGARPIYIYRLAPCTENCSQRIYKTFSIKYLEHVHIFSTFEPKKHKSVFQAAVSTCTLKILCCGYNLATQKRRKFIKNYDTRSCKEYSFSSLSAERFQKGFTKEVNLAFKIQIIVVKSRFYNDFSLYIALSFDGITLCFDSQHSVIFCYAWCYTKKTTSKNVAVTGL